MIQRHESACGSCRFVIRPNRSLTWTQAKLFFLSMAVVCLGVAGAFAAAGFWPVLPFAGLEMLVLGVCLYLSALGGRETEVVHVGEEKVAVEKGRTNPCARWEFRRAWARARLLRPRIRWYPTRLVIGSHGELVQLGAFLNEEERRHLAGELERVLAPPPPK